MSVFICYNYIMDTNGAEWLGDDSDGLVEWNLFIYYAKQYVKTLNWKHRRVRKWGLWSSNLPDELRRKAFIYGWKRAKEEFEKHKSVHIWTAITSDTTTTISYPDPPAIPVNKIGRIE